MVMKVTKSRSLSLHLVFPKFEFNRRRGEVVTQRNAVNFYRSLLPICADAMRRTAERWREIIMSQVGLKSTEIGTFLEIPARTVRELWRASGIIRRVFGIERGQGARDKLRRGRTGWLG